MTEAVLLVGGKGTRLQPLTLTTPKPMVPAAGVPFLAHQLARARDAGVRHVVLATSYLAEVFEPCFGDGSAHGLRLTYVTEDVPLGTGGAVRAAADALTSGPADPVLVLNGDILSGLDLRGLLHRHERAGADVTLHLTRAEDPRAFGLVPTGPGGRVLAFTVVLDGARVEEGARIHASMVGRQARVGPRTVLHGAVIGDHAGVGADNELRDGARVWCGTTIPDAAIRFSAA